MSTLGILVLFFSHASRYREPLKERDRRNNWVQRTAAYSDGSMINCFKQIMTEV